MVIETKNKRGESMQVSKMKGKIEQRIATDSVDIKPFVIVEHFPIQHKLLKFLLKTTELNTNIVDSLEDFMEQKTFDNPNQAVTQLTDWLGINETYLAGFLGVSPKSLMDWKKRGSGDLPPKGLRLARLHAVVSYMRDRHKEIPPQEYKGLLENGRLVIDPNDDDEGSISLLNFIIEEPNARVWASAVDHVVKEYGNLLRAAGRIRETNQPVRDVS
jgi:hypothetical protein